MHLLRLVWGGAAVGILQMLFLPKAPRLLTTLIYIALGWVIVPHATEVRARHACLGQGSTRPIKSHRIASIRRHKMLVSRYISGADKYLHIGLLTSQVESGHGGLSWQCSGHACGQCPLFIPRLEPCFQRSWSQLCCQVLRKISPRNSIPDSPR